jgi:TolB-like protein/cytochrome c-type biogenesis protein CcmH/NrfG
VPTATLIQRLRERRVFRSAGYYVLGAWGLLQVGDVIIEPAGLPEWSMTALLYLLVLGFPLAIFLGWRYDITDHGIVRTAPNVDGEVDPETLRLRAVDYLVVVALLAVLGFAAYQMMPIAQQAEEIAQAGGGTAAEAPLREGSIAVLPFADLSQGGGQGFLGDGISDTVMHVLAQVEDLEVTARTSSFAFKNQQLDIREIGEALGVAHVLEGSVQRAGEEVRIIARLINVGSGAEVWSGYYDRAMDSIFAIQDEIAQEVTTALMVKVLGGDDVAVEPAYQPNLEAFEALILGRAALDRGGLGNAREAYDYFEKATQLDPNYALAYVMLANATTQVAPALGLSRVELVQRASGLISKALDLDPLLPEAHLGRARGGLAMKDFEQAEASARRALELRPSEAAAYDVLADIYFTQSRFDDMLSAARKAVELDPEEYGYQLGLARALWGGGRAEAAVVKLRALIRAEPERPDAYALVARYLRQSGRSGEAQYWTGRALALDPDNPQRRLAFCSGLVQLWDFDEGQACLDRYLEDFPGDPEATSYLASMRDDTELGLANARAEVERNPNFWYRKMQLADWLVEVEAYEEAIELFRGALPGLYASPPQVNDMSIWAAQNVVRALQGIGRDDQADALIDAALSHLEMQRKLQSSHLTTGIDDVFFLSLRGEIGEAVRRLTEAIDRDYQFFSFGLTQIDRAHPELAADPGFQAQVQRLDEIMAQERAWYYENRDRDLLQDAAN